MLTGAVSNGSMLVGWAVQRVLPVGGRALIGGCSLLERGSSIGCSSIGGALATQSMLAACRMLLFWRALTNQRVLFCWGAFTAWQALFRVRGCSMLKRHSSAWGSSPIGWRSLFGACCALHKSTATGADQWLREHRSLPSVEAPLQVRSPSTS